MFNDILFYILIALVVILIGLFITMFIDYITSVNKQGVGVVTGKEFIKEHTTTTWNFNAATKTSYPTTTYHDDEWLVYIKVEGLINSISVTKGYYNSIKIGKSINVEYSIGRILNILYLNKIL